MPSPPLDVRIAGTHVAAAKRISTGGMAFAPNTLSCGTWFAHCLRLQDDVAVAAWLTDPAIRDIIMPSFIHSLFVSLLGMLLFAMPLAASGGSVQPVTGTFDVIPTLAINLELELKPGFSTGIHEWESGLAP